MNLVFFFSENDQCVSCTMLVTFSLIETPMVQLSP